LNEITISLFFVFFIPTFIMVRKVFRNDELRYAGYVMALVSAMIAAMMLSDPTGFFNSALSRGIFPTIFAILFAGFCLIPVGAFMVLLFAGIKERVRLLLHQDHFHHEFPVAGVQQEWIPEVREEGVEEDLRISEVGREQIVRLIQAEKKDYGIGRKKSGYIFISSEYGEENGESNPS